MFTPQLLQLMDLGPQDKVIAMEPSAYGQPAYERMYFVECIDLHKGLVHVLTGSGSRRSIAFEDILDIQKTRKQLTVPAELTGWDARYCDPHFVGKPLPILSLDVSQTGRLQSVCVPKWPGQRPGEVKHLYISAHTLGLTEQELFSVLPTNKSIRFHDMASARNRLQRTATQRFSRYLSQALQDAGALSVPIDPSLQRKGAMLVAAEAA